MSETLLDAHYWNERYQNSATGWDIGAISTPLKEYIDQLDSKEIRILIPGCGNAYEAAYLLEKGFTNITLIDIAPALTKKLADQFPAHINKSLHIITGDFFQLQGQYDLILEQTFFCALDPALRDNYASKMKELLAPQGKLAGVLFNRDFPGGPPFGGSIAEYKKLFSGYFESVYLEPCYNSIEPRKDAEAFVILSNKF